MLGYLILVQFNKVQEFHYNILTPVQVQYFIYYGLKSLSNGIN
jgi:hypothetical protein